MVNIWHKVVIFFPLAFISNWMGPIQSTTLTNKQSNQHHIQRQKNTHTSHSIWLWIVLNYDYNSLYNWCLVCLFFQASKLHFTAHFLSFAYFFFLLSSIYTHIFPVSYDHVSDHWLFRNWLCEQQPHNPNDDEKEKKKKRNQYECWKSTKREAVDLWNEQARSERKKNRWIVL